MNVEVGAAKIPGIIERQFRELAPVRATYLNAGMDSVAYRVNDRWVFRFPMRDAVERQLLIEHALLPVIAPRLPLAIPSFRFWGTPSDDFPMHFAGYEMLPGPTGTEIDQALLDFDALAPTLGACLSALHSFPVGDAERLGAEVSRVEEHWEEVRRDAIAGLELVPALAPDAPVDRVRRYLEELRPLPAPPWPLCLVHQDLGAEHVLVDPSGKRVTGVIDWGDVAIADPSIDFVGLYAWGGERFVRAVLRHYDGAVDERVIERVRPWATFKVVQDIRFGLDHDDPGIIRVALNSLSA